MCHFTWGHSYSTWLRLERVVGFNWHFAVSSVSPDFSNRCWCCWCGSFTCLAEAHCCNRTVTLFVIRCGSWALLALWLIIAQWERVSQCYQLIPPGLWRQARTDRDTKRQWDWASQLPQGDAAQRTQLSFNKLRKNISIWMILAIMAGSVMISGYKVMICYVWSVQVVECVFFFPVTYIFEAL